MDDYEEEFESEEESEEWDISDKLLEERCQKLYDLYNRVIVPHQKGEMDVYEPEIMNRLTPEAFVRHFLDN